MKLKKFEEKCSLAKLKIIGSHTDDGLFFIVADGFSEGALEFPTLHYRTIYAIGRSPDALVLAQSIYHDFGKDLGKHNLQDARVQDAFETARVVAERLKEYGGLIKT